VAVMANAEVGEGTSDDLRVVKGVAENSEA
jgi:hypothetical protein